MTRQRDYIIIDLTPRPAPSIARIKATVADYYHIAPIHLESDRRERSVARPRQVAMYLARNLTKMSLPNIGHHIGGRDHSTVIHGIRNITRLRVEDGELAQDLVALTARLAA